MSFAYLTTMLFAYMFLGCVSSFYILDINSFQIYGLQIFSPILWVIFLPRVVSASCVLWCIEVLILMK